MSIFDTDIRHPLEQLFNEVKEIVEYVIPDEMMHYNTDPGHIIYEISQMLDYKKLFYSHTIPYKDQKYTICGVSAKIEGHKRGIPFYKVTFYIPELTDDGFINNKHFVDLYVGISGIINDNI
jgi:hypothetical protein